MHPIYPPRFSEDDLLEIARNTRPFIEQFRNQNFLILGGSGFIGSWLAASLGYLNKAYKLEIKITCSVRNPELVDKDPNSEINLISQLMLEPFLTEYPPDFIFHCATPTKSSNQWQSIEPEKILDLTNDVINICTRLKKKARFLHLSSGAVYGFERRKFNLPMTLKMEEANVNDLNEYGKLKLNLEKLITDASLEGKISGTNLRLFTFYGPGLAIGKPFAITNFIESSILNQVINISGQESSIRTYMYPTDLISNLLFQATQISSGTVLIGGAEKVTIGKLAQKVGKIWGAQINYKSNNEPADHYYPDFGGEFNSVSLTDGLNRWKRWLSHQSDLVT